MHLREGGLLHLGVAEQSSPTGACPCGGNQDMCGAHVRVADRLHVGDRGQLVYMEGYFFQLVKTKGAFGVMQCRFL